MSTSTLYHYTNGNGLLGIFSSKELWLSHIGFLNDSNEIRLALELLKAKLLTVDRQVLPDATKQKIIDVACNNAAYMICAMSFCEKGDLLSQWRGYASQQGGYAIGFDREGLTQVAKNGCELQQCIYDEEQQQDLVSKIIDNILETRRSLDPSVETMLTAQIASHYFEFWLPKIKDGSFSEEREWRLVHSGHEEQDTNYKFRSL